MSDKELSETMAEAYQKYSKRSEAILAVKEIYPHISNETFELMWDSIDAYCDLYL